MTTSEQAAPTPPRVPLIDHWLAHRVYPGELYGPPAGSPPGGGSWLDQWRHLVDERVPPSADARDVALSEVFVSVVVALRQRGDGPPNPDPGTVTQDEFNAFFGEIAAGRVRLQPPPPEPTGKKSKRRKKEPPERLVPYIAHCDGFMANGHHRWSYPPGWDKQQAADAKLKKEEAAARRAALKAASEGGAGEPGPVVNDTADDPAFVALRAEVEVPFE